MFVQSAVILVKSNKILSFLQIENSKIIQSVFASVNWIKEIAEIQKILTFSRYFSPMPVTGLGSLKESQKSPAGESKDICLAQELEKEEEE